MEQARRDLARQEGLLCEIATASVIAGLPRLPLVDNATRICCIVTGSGLKDLDHLARDAGPVPRIPASLDALAAVPDLPPRT